MNFIYSNNIQVELQGEYYILLEYSSRATGGILYIPRIFK